MVTFIMKVVDTLALFDYPHKWANNLEGNFIDDNK